MFSQIPTPAPGQLENWLIPAAAIASMALLAKKLFTRNPVVGRATPCAPHGHVGHSVPTAPLPDLITRTEFHHELNTIRDKIDARFLSLSEKIEALGEALHQNM